MNDAAKKRGRPVKVNSRTHRVVIRLNDEEWAIAERIRAKTGMTIANIFRAALRLYNSMRFE